MTAASAPEPGSPATTGTASTRRSVTSRVLRSSKRIGVLVAGGAVLLAGVAMLVLPGPGLLVIVLGLAILATEFAWAARLQAKAKHRYEQGKQAVVRRRRRR